MHISKLTNEAFEAFWEVIAKHFPQATSGDLSPEATICLELAAQSAVVEWIVFNALYPKGMPDTDPGYRFKLRHDVDRFPDFIAPAGSTGTIESTDNGVWAKMDQPIKGAADNLIHWDNHVDFLFDTMPLAGSEAA